METTMGSEQLMKKMLDKKTGVFLTHTRMINLGKGVHLMLFYNI